MLDQVEAASEHISASSKGFGAQAAGKSECGAKVSGAKLQFNLSNAIGCKSVVGDNNSRPRKNSDLIPGDELNNVKAQPESWKAFGEEPYDEAVIKSGNFAGRRQRLSPTANKAILGAGPKRDCKSNQ